MLYTFFFFYLRVKLVLRLQIWYKESCNYNIKRVVATKYEQFLMTSKCVDRQRQHLLLLLLLLLRRQSSVSVCVCAICIHTQWYARLMPSKICLHSIFFYFAKKNEMEQLFCCCCYCCCSGISKASRQTEDLDSLSTQMNRKTFHNEQTTEKPRDIHRERKREREGDRVSDQVNKRTNDVKLR